MIFLNIINEHKSWQSCLAYTYDSFDLFGPLTAFVHDTYINIMCHRRL